jgi:hypothetical protein
MLSVEVLREKRSFLIALIGTISSLDWPDLHKTGEFLSRSRRRDIIEARRVMCWLSVKELGYSGAGVARYLGVTNSCVTRAASSGEVPDRDKYL